ncbi:MULTISPECIES: glycosyltransferase [unclassified Leucobacter]|uniref:glycosyltransferase n=1 Tax=unclassified Leucobacter TaxID=2621730 RepID=UPI00165E3776|nr:MULTISPECIES: glycosyltransferase [unclassified Leucobacter]MBC9936356.1 glycosyltransferase [Leucobacter sp. cx-87]
MPKPVTLASHTPADAHTETPLRILLACDTFLPDVNGAARFAERLAAGLVRDGHEVHVAAPSMGHGAAGTFVEEIEGERVTVHRWASFRWYPHDWLRFVLPWRARYRSRQLLDALQPDVIHLQSHVIIGRGLAIEGAKRGIRIVATNHVMPENVLDFTLLPHFAIQSFIKWAWRQADKILRLASAVTTPTKRAAEFLERNTSIRGVRPVSCGLRASDYTPSFAERSEQRVVFVGRLTMEKQIDVILRAVARLGANVKLDLVGGGDQRKNLERLAHELGIDDRVVFHGRVSDQQLRATLTNGSVFAIASIAELQSIATLEAMASGLPILAADAMALPHLVEEGKNGYLFTPGDDAELARRIAEILELPHADYVRMQEASLEAVKVHDIERTLATFESLYRGETPAA